MLKFALVVLLPLSIIFYGAYSPYLSSSFETSTPQKRDVLEKLTVADGSVTLDLFGLNPSDSDRKTSNRTILRFDASGQSFFTIKVLNGELRGPMPGTLQLVSKNSVDLPPKLSASLSDLVLEKMVGGDHELGIKDGTSGFTFV